MIEIQGIKIPVGEDTSRLEQQICKRLHIKSVPAYQILKRSIDARKKPEIFYQYTVGVTLANEQQIVQKINDNNVMLTDRAEYCLPECGTDKMKHHPLVVGAGPAGLFAALLLAQKGYVPIIAERGHCVEERVKEVNDFFSGKPLNPECNVQFGEGGAGTFSDGKLNTQVKDKYGRIRFILETFVRHGAPEEILFDYKPHVGTDKLVEVVRGIRREIERYGGVFLFDAKVTDIRIANGQITGAKISHHGFETWVDCSQVILAIGHSARDTFTMLDERNVPMCAKDFAMGVRVEHPASWINRAMYGEEAAGKLPAAPYKLTHNTLEGRGVYSFCMCPGGYVVNASSEEGGTVVNGMSYSGRNGSNSNSAIVVSVKREDFEDGHPLAGMRFQRKLEQRIYEEGNGKVVVQRFADFRSRIPTTKLGQIMPQIKGDYCLGNVAGCLPDFMWEGIVEGIEEFEQKISGFADEDTVISGIESRTSSPIRIERDKDFVSTVKGLYPCGEGAGYAGGIMSAAIDGMKTAEAVIRKYWPKQEKENTAE
ncbi:MAG: FAD-dependent oxidoreductase [Clostridium sp.]|nr:FAD-dependent oxidoreductase [Clostridium sp.]